MKHVLLAFVSGMTILLAGCGPDISNLPKTVTAKGVVLIDGQPVENATVTFIADTGNYHATANTDASGRFALKAFPQKEGAVSGSYKVEINKTIVSGGGDTTRTDGEGGPVTVKFGLPKKYATFGTSGLKNTIPEGGTSDIKFELTSK